MGSERTAKARIKIGMMLDLRGSIELPGATVKPKEEDLLASGGLGKTFKPGKTKTQL